MGEQVAEEEWLFEITELNGKQIRRVLAKRVLPEKTEPGVEVKTDAEQEGSKNTVIEEGISDECHE